MSQRFSLAGKTAFVTGGSRGIGAAIALGLAEAGADVILSYREKQAEAETVAAEIKAMGRKADIVRMDVTSKPDIDAVVKNLGPVSVLVNNAGINKPTDFDQVTETDWDMILSANLKGPFMVAQAVLPLMKDGGSIIHMRRPRRGLFPCRR